MGCQGVCGGLPDVIGELQTALGDIEIDLMQSEGAAFVAALIDSEPNDLSAEFRVMLYRHTTGNPLFTIELLRGMQLRGEIRRSRHGRWVEGPLLHWNELAALVGQFGGGVDTVDMRRAKALLDAVP